MTNGNPQELADVLVAQYRIPAHFAAVNALDDYVDEYSPTDLPFIWHYLARFIADVYTTAGLTVLPPDAEPSPNDQYEVYDHHARKLVIICQENQLDARAAIDAYASDLGEDIELKKGIVLCLAHLVSEGTNPPN